MSTPDIKYVIYHFRNLLQAELITIFNTVEIELFKEHF